MSGDRQLLGESCALPLKALRLQIPATPGGAAIGLRLVRDLLWTLDERVHLVVAVQPGSDIRALRALLDHWDQPARRVRWVESGVASPFAQDNAVTMVERGGGHCLLLPRDDQRIGLGQGLRRADLERGYGMTIRRSRFYFEGGEICRDGEHCLVSANTVARNMVAGGRDAESVLAGMARAFGLPVSMLGDLDEALEVARHGRSAPRSVSGRGAAESRLESDVTLLGRVIPGGPPVAAIAATAVSPDLLDGILENAQLFQDHFLPPGEMRSAFLSGLEVTMRRREPRLAHYRKTLAGLGYRIVEIPDVRLDPDLNPLGRVNFTFNYVNVVPARQWYGEAACYYLSCGMERVEAAVRATYAAAGLRAIPVNPDSAVSGNEIMLLGGGLHRATSKLG